MTNHMQVFCSCGVMSGGIHPDRLATEDEVPAA